MKPLIFFFLLLITLPLNASDTVRTGTGARAIGMANINGLANDPLTAMSGNPALLTSQDTAFQISASTIFVDSSFSNGQTSNAKADSGPGFIPDLAAVWAPTGSRFSLGAGITAHSALEADFTFQDPPGTSGSSYGLQGHKAQYIVLKGTLGAGYQLTDRLSLGASAGVVWNRNRLKAPYIFQSHPVLSGLKVLISLDTDDFALFGNLGFAYQLDENVRLNLAYSFATDFRATGDLNGTLSALGLGIQDEFLYDAEVRTTLPRILSAGLDWDTASQIRLGVQLDWINWKNAFKELPIRLTNGNNNDLNGFLGTNQIVDTAPLDWKDQYVIHLAGEYNFSDQVKLRAGYEYANIPVPQSTMTPMTGAILKHAISVGLGYQLNNYVMDIAYRWSINNRVDITNSSLLGGEYDNTSLKVGLHTFAISISY